MISLDIPGYGHIDIEHLVTDYSGTLSEDGTLLNGLKGKLNDLSEKIHIHILTSDTFGKARTELNGVNCTLHVLEGTDHTGQKEKYILMLGADRVVALGNGNNDAKMLKASRLSICVCLKEGCSVEALKASQVFLKSPIDAIDLFLNPKRLIATLRR
jgi:soluble P-type ATPase